ncbi:MAG: MlaD family protein, partial [Pseudomonadota bacterium]
IFLVCLGAGSLFKPSQLAETYFDESVQGLNVGSPVKYRGVTVGKVTAIGMVSTLYNTANDSTLSNQEQRYIYVQFSLAQQLRHSETNPENIQKIIHGYVKNGLRTSLATQDLVGNAYLALNFSENKTAPILPISWTPTSIYIPSTQSTLSQVTDNISNIASQLNKIDFAKIMNDFDQLTLTLNKSVSDIQADHLSQKLSDALTQTSTAMQQLNLLSTKANLLVANQQKNWDTTFSELRQMSLNLASMSNTLKNNPSAAIFGSPVQPMDPSR